MAVKEGRLNTQLRIHTHTQIHTLLRSFLSRYCVLRWFPYDFDRLLYKVPYESNRVHDIHIIYSQYSGKRVFHSKCVRCENSSHRIVVGTSHFGLGIRRVWTSKYLPFSAIPSVCMRLFRYSLFLSLGIMFGMPHVMRIWNAPRRSWSCIECKVYYPIDVERAFDLLTHSLSPMSFGYSYYSSM